MSSLRACSFCEKEHITNQHFPYCSSTCCTKANRKDSGQLVEPETNTPMVCFCCGDEFIIEHNFPGMDPAKIHFCSFYCAAKGSEPFLRERYKYTTVKKEEKEDDKEKKEDDKEKEKKEEEEEFDMRLW